MCNELSIFFPTDKMKHQMRLDKMKEANSGEETDFPIEISPAVQLENEASNMVIISNPSPILDKIVHQNDKINYNSNINTNNYKNKNNKNVFFKTPLRRSSTKDGATSNEFNELKEKLLKKFGDSKVVFDPNNNSNSKSDTSFSNNTYNNNRKPYLTGKSHPEKQLRDGERKVSIEADSIWGYSRQVRLRFHFPEIKYINQRIILYVVLLILVPHTPFRNKKNKNTK